MYKVSLIYLTRKCSCKCPHCMIWRRRLGEIPPSKWLEIINSWNKTYAEFFVIMGGEPLEYYKGFESILEIVRGLKNVDYGFSSNSLHLTWSRAKKLVEAGLSNWTVSIDKPEGLGDSRDEAGWKALKWFKKLGVEDLVVLITLYPDNVIFFPRIVQELMSLEVWILPTFVMWAKAPWYDSFPPSCKPDWRPIHLRYIQEGLRLLRKYKKFHGVEKMFTEDLPLMFKAEFRCGRLLVPTIEEDGYMRLCRDIPGDKVRKWHALNVIRKEGFEEIWLEDYKRYCLGCSWDCAYHAKMNFNKFIHRV